jgi:hypothetical protein
MAMKRFKRAVAVTGTYQDAGGNEKKRYTNVGTLFQRDDGSFLLKMEAVPVEWNGWISFYDLDEQKQPAAQAGGRQAGNGGGIDDSIPF